MNGLDILGGAGDGLKNQIIVARVMHIDAPRLRAKLALSGGKDAGVQAALTTADYLPKAAYDIGLPMLSRMLKDDYGVDVKLTAADVSPTERSKSELFPGLAIGAVVGGLSWGLIFRPLWRWFVA